MSDGRTTGSVDVGPHGPSGKTISARIDRDLARTLNHLIHLGHDITNAYQTALARLTSQEHVAVMREFEGAHDRHIRELGAFVGSVGHKASRHGDLRWLLEKGRVVIGRLRGDRGILAAMAQNEKALAEAYRAALALPGVPVPVRQSIATALAEEERHQAFYDRVLARDTG